MDRAADMNAFPTGITSITSSTDGCIIHMTAIATITGRWNWPDSLADAEVLASSTCATDRGRRCSRYAAGIQRDVAGAAPAASVSTADRDFARQVKALKAARTEQVYSEKTSGSGEEPARADRLFQSQRRSGDAGHGGPDSGQYVTGVYFKNATATALRLVPYRTGSSDIMKDAVLCPGSARMTDSMPHTPVVRKVIEIIDVRSRILDEWKPGTAE
jgi:hypothetical protein